MKKSISVKTYGPASLILILLLFSLQFFQGCGRFNLNNDSSVVASLGSGDGQGFEGKKNVYLKPEGNYYWVDPNYKCEDYKEGISHIRGIIEVRDAINGIFYHEGCKLDPAKAKKVSENDIIVTPKNNFLAYMGIQANFERFTEPPHNDEKAKSLVGVCYVTFFEFLPGERGTILGFVGTILRQSPTNKDQFDTLITYVSQDLSQYNEKDIDAGMTEGQLDLFTSTLDSTPENRFSFKSTQPFFNLDLEKSGTPYKPLRPGIMEIDFLSRSYTYEFDDIYQNYDEVEDQSDSTNCVFRDL